MKNRRIIVTILTTVILLLSSCSDTVPAPVHNDDSSVSWNGWTLTRYVEPYNYPSYDTYSWINVQPNVLTTKQSTLSLSLTATDSDSYEFGTTEQIHVLLEGRWYVLPFELSAAEQPLTLPAREKGVKPWPSVEYDIDLSVIGALPVGAYRLAEELISSSDGTVETRYARFWIMNTYAQSPPEAATEGKARLEDIVLSVDSSYPAQRTVTTEDDMFTVVLENLSGKTYKAIFADEEDDGIVLERLTDGRWTQVQYSTANSHGSITGWNIKRMEVFIFDVSPEGSELPTGSLYEGRYRIRFPMKADTEDVIEPSCEFDVLSPEDAPPPEWDMEELWVSDHSEDERSAGIFIAPKQSILDGSNALLEVEYTVNGTFSYGPEFEMEMYIDGQWYTLPFADARTFVQPLFTIEQSGTGNTEQFDLKSSFGSLPAGKYRVIKSFNNQETGDTEFAAAEFTVSG